MAGAEVDKVVDTVEEVILSVHKTTLFREKKKLGIVFMKEKGRYKMKS